MLLKELKQRTGGLSNPSKMPCYSYGIPARECKTGSKHAKIPGTICFFCYASKNFYAMPNVDAAMVKRHETLDRDDWVESMTELIRKKEKTGYFRWHDSGDIQSLDHLKKIAEIARRLPDIQFWLPTRELSIYSEYLRTEETPENLHIRVSAFKVDFPGPKKLGGKPVLASTVHTHGKEPEGHICLAEKQGNKCGSCRACWDPSIQSVSYLIH